MALTAKQKSDIRRHLRYGNIGLSINGTGGGSLGTNAGLRYFSEQGGLEQRMDSLQPIDEAAITGAAFASLILQGMNPNVGDTLTVQFSGGNLVSPVNVSYSAIAGQLRNDFGLAFSAKCAQTVALAAAGIISLMPANGGLSGVQNPLSEISFLSPVPFNVAITAMTGNIGASLTANGSLYPDPQIVVSKVNYYGFLQILNCLDGVIATTSDRLGIDKADVFTARKTEIKERQQLYNVYLDSFSNFLQIPINKLQMNQRTNIGNL